MSVTEKLQTRADEEHDTNYREELVGIFGPGYHKGIDLGRRFETQVIKDALEELRPPIFAEDESHDRGESLGFQVYFGVAPGLPFSEVANVIKHRFKLDVAFVPVTSEDDLTDIEKTFMMGRLPAVRLCPVTPESSSAAAA